MSFQPSKPPRRSRAPMLIGLVVAVVVVAAAAVVVFARGGSDDSDVTTDTLGLSAPPTASTDATGPTLPPTSLPPITNGGPKVATAAVTVTGTPLAAFPDAGADPANGQVFPDISGVKVTDSSPMAITNDGRPKVVIYLAHWCPHCRAEVPMLTKYLAAKGFPAGVDLYAVSTAVSDKQSNFPPADWLLAERFPIPTLADDTKSTAFTAAGLKYFPSFVAVGADGTVKRRATGELGVEDFETLLANALS